MEKYAQKRDMEKGESGKPGDDANIQHKQEV